MMSDEMYMTLAIVSYRCICLYILPKAYELGACHCFLRSLLACHWK
jgi:hypothetical protein